MFSFFNQDRFMKQNQTTRIRPAVVLRVHCSVKCTLKILRRVYSACFLSSLGSQWPRLTNTQTAEMINGLIRGDDVLARIQFIIARSFLESFWIFKKVYSSHGESRKYFEMLSVHSRLWQKISLCATLQIFFSSKNTNKRGRNNIFRS